MPSNKLYNLWPMQTTTINMTQHKIVNNSELLCVGKVIECKLTDNIALQCRGIFDHTVNSEIVLFTGGICF